MARLARRVVHHLKRRLPPTQELTGLPELDMARVIERGRCAYDGYQRGSALAHAPDLASMAPVLDRLQQTAQSVAQSLFDHGGAPAAPARDRLAENRARGAWRSLRQNLRFESDAFRHALRVGVGATIADTIFGVTMGAEGVSQIVARRLKRDVEGPARPYVRRALHAIPGGLSG